MSTSPSFLLIVRYIKENISCLSMIEDLSFKPVTLRTRNIILYALMELSDNFDFGKLNDVNKGSIDRYFNELLKVNETQKKLILELIIFTLFFSDSHFSNLKNPSVLNSMYQRSTRIANQNSPTINQQNVVQIPNMSFPTAQSILSNLDSNLITPEDSSSVRLTRNYFQPTSDINMVNPNFPRRIAHPNQPIRSNTYPVDIRDRQQFDLADTELLD